MPVRDRASGKSETRLFRSSCGFWSVTGTQDALKVTEAARESPVRSLRMVFGLGFIPDDLNVFLIGINTVELVSVFRVCLPICLSSVRPPACLSVCLPACIPVCLPPCLLAYLPACLPVFSVCLSVCVCLSVPPSPTPECQNKSGQIEPGTAGANDPAEGHSATHG